MRSKKVLYILLLFIFLTGCKEETYTISFDTLGGSIIDSITISEGENYIDIKSPTKEGYLFVNWLKDGVEYDFNDPITEDITLTANWIETPEIYNYYTITFEVEGVKESTTVKEGELVKELKAPEIKDYLFLGWYLNNQKFDFNTPITENITLVAKYEFKYVTITYDLDGGIGLTLETIPRYTTISIPMTPIKLGYRFLKWTLDDKEFSFDTKVTKDITLKAQWSKIEYVTVTYDTDGGTIINPQKIEKYSQLKDLKQPEKEGYTFLYWQLNDNQFDNTTKIDSDITLKAIYKENE